MLTLLTWIVIAFIIAVIFGIVKVEDVKAFTAKWMPKLVQLLFQAKDAASKKAAELKEAAEKNKEATEKSQDNSNSDNNSAK